MQAIEFHATIREGKIELPEAYRDQIRGDVRVIILTQPKAKGTGVIAQLLQNPIQDPDFKPLSRDEIYGDRT